MLKKLFITKETHEFFLLRRPRERKSHFCRECGEKVRWLKPEEIVCLANISERAIFRLVENGRIHSMETVEGLLLICVESLKTK